MGTSKKKKKIKKLDDNNAEKNLKKNIFSRIPKSFTYTLPGQKQRLILGSIVIGLNLLLLGAIYLYFNNPAFKDFVFQIGR